MMKMTSIDDRVLVPDEVPSCKYAKICSDLSKHREILCNAQCRHVLLPFLLSEKHRPGDRQFVPRLVARYPSEAPAHVYKGYGMRPLNLQRDLFIPYP